MTSSQLAHLLRKLWRSTIFGNAFPAIDAVSLMGSLQGVYSDMSEQFKEIIRQGMPLASEETIIALVHQIAPKSTAFSVAILAGEIEDNAQLQAIAVVVAMIYWADHLVDRGDEAMAQALQAILTHAPAPTAPEVQSRWRALLKVEQLVSYIARPEDAPLIIHGIWHETLERQVAWHRYSHAYLMNGREWDQAFVKTLAECATNNTGLVTIVSLLYGAYRVHQPTLPPLSQILTLPELMSVLCGSCQAALRVFDDVGDRAIDTGESLEWGMFSLNLFNQPPEQYIEEFLFRAGVTNLTLRTLLLDTFQTPSQLSQSHIVRVFMDLVYTQIHALSESVSEEYELILRLSKRLIEAGYVNAVGDRLLVERVVSL